MLRKRKSQAARVVEVLVAARKQIARKGGWTQWTLKDPETGAVCAVGAVMDNAKRAISIRRAAVEYLGRALPRTYSQRGCYVATYNDVPHRRQSDVVKLFDRAIKEAKKDAKIQTKIK